MELGQRLYDAVDQPFERQVVRIEGEGALVNGAHLVGVTQGERGKHGIAIGKELVQRAFRRAGLCGDGLGRRGHEPLFGDHRRGRIEQQLHALLSARLPRSPPEGIALTARRRLRRHDGVGDLG